MSISDFSSNAVLAKARAMYGRHLTPDDYKNLLACKTVSEVAYYLKNNTDYAATLSDIGESEVHRGRLEQFLRRRAFADAARLSAYDLAGGAQFSDYLVRYAEVEQIMHAVTYLASGSTESYLFSVPLHFSHLVRFDLTQLAQITSFADLLEVLKPTPYRALLLPFRPLTGGSIDYTAIETALFTNLYSVAYEIIRKTRSKQAAAELKRLFDSYIDIQNYLRIRRLKLLYGASPDDIRSRLLPYGSVQKERLREALYAENDKELIKNFPILSHMDSEELSGLLARGTMQMHFLYGLCLHQLRFSVYPSVTLISYFFLSEIEIQDIIHIIEGIRYGLPQNEIRKLLTILNYQKKSGGD